MNINLHIERLMLDGLSIAGGEDALVQTAVEAELGRLLATELLARPESSAQACVGGAEIHPGLGVSARELGVEIGRSVFASLASYGFGQPGQARRAPGLSAHPDLPRTSKAPSPLRPAAVGQDFIEPVRRRESRQGSQQPFNRNQRERKIVCQQQK